MNTPFALSLATAAEATELSALMRASFMAAYGHIAPLENLDRYQARAYAVDALAHALAQGEIEIWVARDAQGHPAGYVQIATRAGAAPITGAPAALELQRCYLRPAYFGSGAAALLMDRAKQRAGMFGAERLYLSVYQHAPRAIAFYRRQGLEVAAAVRFYIDEIGFDDWSMVCELGAKQPAARGHPQKPAAEDARG